MIRQTVGTQGTSKRGFPLLLYLPLSVSYTHLDVYKRQGHDNGHGIIQKGFFHFLFDIHFYQPWIWFHHIFRTQINTLFFPRREILPRRVKSIFVGLSWYSHQQGNGLFSLGTFDGTSFIACSESTKKGPRGAACDPLRAWLIEYLIIAFFLEKRNVLRGFSALFLSFRFRCFRKNYFIFENEKYCLSFL